MPGFSASRFGIVAHSGILLDTTRIVWYDRRGAVSALTEPAHYTDPRISPDGRKVAWSRVDSARFAPDIWVFDSERGTTTRVTSDPLLETSPIWSRDGAQILYRSNRTGTANLYVRDLSTGADRTILNDRQWHAHTGTRNAAPNDWSPDGRYVIYTVALRTGFDLFRLSLEPNSMPEALVTSAFNEMHAALSPDGERLAFASDESGLLEVYVQSYPEGRGRQLVSVAGGAEPKWRGDGRELYFLNPGGKLMAASFNGAGEAGRPQELFPVRTPAPHTYRQNYHASADGQRFAVNAIAEGRSSAVITVVVNSPVLAR
jgi:Tol biopolymer transport system component